MGKVSSCQVPSMMLHSLIQLNENLCGYRGDLVFKKYRQFMFFLLREKVQGIHIFQSVPQRVATLKLVLDLAKDFTNLVLDSIGAGGSLLEAL